MSNIKFNVISEDLIEVFVSPDTPVQMVEELNKSLISKGLIQDLNKSTVSTRYFYKPQDKLNDLADKLLKSLGDLTKDDYDYSLKAKFAHQAKMRDMDRKSKMTNTSPRPSPNYSIFKDPNHEPAGGTGRKYADITDYTKINKQECKKSDGSCECAKCEVEKSNYKGAGVSQYNPNDNFKRKLNNTGDQTGIGPNVNTKKYTSAKFGSSTPQTDPKLKKPQPVKVFSEEEKARLAREKGLVKSWAEHLPFPNAEEEMARIAKAQRDAKRGEDAAANQLAMMMKSKAMLGHGHNQPSEEDMIMAGQNMGLGVTEDMIKAQDKQWDNTINNWLAEATKPISQRFSSEEEELAYWKNIGVSDRDDGKPGY